MSTGKIIKSSSAANMPLTGIVKRPVIDAKAEARRIIAEAGEQAASILESAESSAKQIREAAHREGFETALLELNQHLLDAKESRDAALAEVEKDVLRLCVKIAEKIIGRELKRNDATIAEIVATAMRSVRQQETLLIRINPADAPLVQTHRERLDMTGRTRFLDLVPDSRVARGGCIIEGASETVNAQLDTQLRVLERALLARAEDESRPELIRPPKRRKRAETK